MQAKLAKRFVDTLGPKAATYQVHDTDLAGFVLRVAKTGRRTWLLVYRNKAGRRLSYRLGAYPGLSPEGARAEATSAVGKIASGTDVQAVKLADRAAAERAKVGTLRVFIRDRYAPWAKGHMQSGETQVRRIEADFKDWLDKPMTGLNTWLIEGWRSDRRKAKANPRTINRNLQRLRACVAKAKAWGILEVHPFEGIKPLKTDNTGRVRYLSAAEEADLRKALITRETRMREERDRFNEWLRERRRELLPRHPEGYVDRLRPLVLTALNTGTRRGELFNLKWQDVNLGAKLLTVRGEEKIEEKGGAKSSQTRRVPLNVEALEVLTAWKGQSAKHAPGDRVFPGAGGERLGSIGHAWTGVATLGGLDDFRFHDLRHHFASRLVQGGTDLNIVRELLGHADLSQVLRYAHLDPTNLATAVERVAR